MGGKGLRSEVRRTMCREWCAVGVCRAVVCRAVVCRGSVLIVCTVGGLLWMRAEGVYRGCVVCRGVGNSYDERE